MKKSLTILSLFLLLVVQAARGQNVKVVSQTCPECGVTVYGRLLEASDHKSYCSGAAHGSSSENSGSSWGKEPYSESGAFENVEGRPLTNDEYYELLIRTRCDYCGGTSSKHIGDCTVGNTYKWWQEAMHSGQEWRARTMRDNIVTLILGTDSGKAKLHQMRGIVTTTPPAPSTKLKDYTPEPERPAVSVSAPLMNCPLAQPAPQFSGINLQSVVHEKMQNTAGVHEWGEMHDRYSKYPIEYDIERWTHTRGGAVILGKRDPEGTIRWYVLHPDKSGKYVSDSQLGYVTTREGKKLLLKDVHFEAEGQFVVEEYEEGYKIYVDPVSGYWVANGYDVNIAPMMVNGRYFVLEQGKNSEGKPKKSLHAGLSNYIMADDMVFFDDAIVQRNSYGDCLLNWNWQKLSINGTQYFKDIRCMHSNRGPYYVIEVTEGQFALVSRGFRQVGGIYKSANEALAAWDKQ